MYLYNKDVVVVVILFNSVSMALVLMKKNEFINTLNLLFHIFILDMILYLSLGEEHILTLMEVILLVYLAKKKQIANEFTFNKNVKKCLF